MQLSRCVSLSEPIPRLYGITYYDISTKMAVCHPVPLNIILHTLRDRWHQLKRHRRGWVERLQLEAYNNGRSYERDQSIQRGHKAFTEGYNAGWDCIFDVVKSVMSKPE